MDQARKIVIGGVPVSDESDAFVIAEIGHNHQGSLEKCKDLFRQAKECGCTAVKLQKRDNRSLFTQAMYDSAYNSENAYGPTYGTHREALELGRDAYLELGRLAAELGLVFFATAFDFKSADFLAELGMPAFKIASGDLKSIPLLRYVAKLGKPMIMSTGGGSLHDIERAHDAIMPLNSQLCILQCTASYPVDSKDMNLNVITRLRERFPSNVIGLSDHQNGIALAPVAYALGARVIEKHFTLNRAWKGTDHAFSLEPGGMQKLVRDLRRTREALGDGIKRPLEGELKPLLKMSKKLVAARDLPVGHVLGAADIALKSPGDGISPQEFDRVLGSTLTRPVRTDDTFELAGLSLASSEAVATPAESQPPAPAATFAALVRRIRLVAFDFDGVMTDDTVYVAEDGYELVRCRRGDGMGIGQLVRLGLNVLIISTETNPVVSARARKLKVPCLQSQSDKLEGLKGYAKSLDIPLDAVAYIGNDINDLDCLRAVGLPIAVRNSAPEVLPLARVVTPRDGGEGAVRDVCDLFRAVLEPIT